MGVELYRKPLAVDQADIRVDVGPRGEPALTGYYPNVSGYVGHAVTNPPPAMETRKAFDTYSGDAEIRVHHPYMDVTATWTPAPDTERPDGKQDPLTDGPPRPVLGEIVSHYRRWAGASVTSYMDVPGHTPHPTGVQDGVSWMYVQDPNLARAPYGSLPLDARGGMPATTRAIEPSAMHGWTEQPLLNGQQTVVMKSAALTQQQAGRNELLANSNYAGQSYGAQTAHVAGPTGSVPSVRGRI